MSNSPTLKFSIIDAKLYRGPAGGTPATTAAVNTVKDVSLKITRSEAKINSRLSSWELTAAVMKSAEFEVEFNDDSADADLAAFIAAAVADWPNNVVACVISDGWQKLDADFVVSNMERSEKLEENITYKFTLKPTYYTAAHLPSWTVATAQT